MDLRQQLHLLQQATCPEEVFGEGETAVKATYRHLAAQTHPDAHPHDQAAADEAFKLLQTWYAEAQRKITQGCYGQPLRIRVT
ncbi:MAG: J domain-containing protein, partial [Anaerolineales bacterium]|nr:J domain-containing protein [Anaerolineales bacterium]